MRQQSYLVRKGAKYHFRRRMRHAPSKRPINLALGTADPVEARRLARRLAARWDEIEMYVGHRIERGTLTLTEQEALFRRGLEDELAKATAHLTAPMGAAGSHPAHHKVMAAALKIVARVPHDTQHIGSEVLAAEVDESWTAEELHLLGQTLRLMVTPMTVSRSQAMDALTELKAPVNQGTLGEARSHILRGMAEAHDRAELLTHPVIGSSARGVLALLDDDLIAQLRAHPHAALAHVPPAEADSEMRTSASTGIAAVDHPYFAQATETRFSEQIAALHEAIFEEKGWQPDDGKTLHALEVFAWLTGDKRMTDYRPKDVRDYAARLARIPRHFDWGRLGEKGEMAVPFDPERFKKLPNKGERRSDRTLNSHFSKMEVAAKILMDGYWLPKHGYGQAITFGRVRKSIPSDDADPKRVPLTEENLVALYGLPLWQGGGGVNKRVKAASSPRIWQDAAYWVPLFGSYMGISREEGCGVEVIDFEFDARTPYMLIQANMTKSKDGETPGGLKRESRRRAIPIHPELLRLGLRDYVQAIAEEGYEMIFPELYGELDGDGTYRAFTNKGGKRFYAIAWRYQIDAAHAVVPLPMTSHGKHADFHSQRTFHYSAMASEEVSAALLARHFGHSQAGVGNRSYNRRALTLGEERELAERLSVLVREVPIVTAHVPAPDRVNLLGLNNRSRVGSAKGRNASGRFLA